MDKAPENSVESLVVGAGPAGLTAAFTLAKAGRSVLVIEADPVYVGGISRTINYKGYLIDIGGHRFFSKSRDIENLWRQILPDDFLDRPRLSRIYYKGKFYSYPLRALEALANLGLFESALCMLSFALAKLAPIKSPRSFHDWVRNQFGERLFSIFFKTYTEKVWGMSCDELNADWAAQRIKGLDLATAVFDAVKRTLRLGSGRGRPAAKTLIESFRYPRRGPGMMWEACADKIEALGGRVALGRTLVSLAWLDEAGLWEARITRTDGEDEIVRARHVISSAPLREVAKIVSPAPFALPEIEKLRYRDFLIVALIGKTRAKLHDNWIYIHDPAVKVGRVQNFRSWSPEMIPDEETDCLGLEYFCFDGDGLWNSSDEDLIAQAKAEISRIGLMDLASVTDGCVIRQRKAYPVYDDGYRAIVDAARAEFSRRFPTFHFVGRNGMHKYNNQDHAMMTGLLTAENIIAGTNRYNVWTVNED
ncbi:MAG TPA: NAD(P)/FAD-dependent oxidoreductase, partial [Rhizomicrobium sp.]|nr:NAD(P)/FAD-dependent oxidoreductase [Rhizomicrobium sp.]